ncbi:hypothetical protein EUX98_g1374 [Antrodiella citrinella]|uniref:Uncharacterized protein n=1 Tax=Antrodiella citrinella TaxID=2447956 RepID=A0A4V3XJE1_9APHY|nr:hypothetical protein EUX98_g1374 [Antrodiella citrinella]
MSIDSDEGTQAARYIVVATTGAWVWDVLVSLASDVQTFSAYRITPPDLGHLLSRMVSACFVCLVLVFNVVAVPDCQSLAKVIGWTGAITFPLQSIPFFFCARAVFLNKPTVVAAFAVLWFGILGGSIASAFFIHGSHIGETSMCVAHLGKPYAAGIVSLALHNTMVFVAVSINLMLYTHEETWSGRVKAYMHRRGISQLSKLLMESGQSYIVPIVALNLAAAVINLIPSMPTSYKIAFIVMDVALQNAVTIRIHRLIKSGVISDHPTTTALDHAAILDLTQASRLPALSTAEHNNRTETHSARSSPKSPSDKPPTPGGNTGVV